MMAKSRFCRGIGACLLVTFAATSCGDSGVSSEEFSSVVDEMSSTIPEMLSSTDEIRFDLSPNIREQSCDRELDSNEEYDERTYLYARYESAIDSEEQAEQIFEDFEDEWPNLGWTSGGEQNPRLREQARIAFQRDWGEGLEYSTQGSVTYEEEPDGSLVLIVQIFGECVPHEDSGRGLGSYSLDE